jgi:hypothetical protein
MDLKKLAWIGTITVTILIVGILTVRKVKFNPKFQNNIDRWQINGK